MATLQTAPDLRSATDSWNREAAALLDTVISWSDESVRAVSQGSRLNVGGSEQASLLVIAASPSGNRHALRLDAVPPGVPDGDGVLELFHTATLASQVVYRESPDDDWVMNEGDDAVVPFNAEQFRRSVSRLVEDAER